VLDRNASASGLDCGHHTLEPSEMLLVMAPFAVVRHRVTPSGPALPTLTTLQCPHRGGAARLADVPVTAFDQIRFLRNIISRFYDEHGREPEMSVETSDSGDRMRLTCIPINGTAPVDAIPLQNGMYGLAGILDERSLVYAEQKVIDEMFGREQAQRETWHAWLVSASTARELLASYEDVGVSVDEFRSWLINHERYAPLVSGGLPSLDYATAVRRSNRLGNDLVSKAFTRTWQGRSDDQMVARFVRHLPGSGTSAELGVLDAGCGPAVHYGAFTSMGIRWTGVDSSLGMIDNARKVLAAAHAAPPLAVADLGRLPFKDQSFAGVWLRAALVHVPRSEAPTVLRECSRVLCPDGVLYLNFQPGRGLVVRREGRVFVYYSEDEIAHLCVGAGLTMTDEWDGTTDCGSLGDTRVKRWRHLVMRFSA
jgi:SAM-dependent methyltransferase